MGGGKAFSFTTSVIFTGCLREMGEEGAQSNSACVSRSWQHRLRRRSTMEVRVGVRPLRWARGCWRLERARGPCLGMQNSPLFAARGTAEPWCGAAPLLQHCRALGAPGDGWDVVGAWGSACGLPGPTSPPALPAAELLFAA